MAIVASAAATELRALLLGELARRGRWTLEGNREYWSILESSLVYYGGDSMTNEEEFRKTLTEDEAFALLLDRARLRATSTWGYKGTTDEEFVAWLRENLGLM